MEGLVGYESSSDSSSSAVGSDTETTGPPTHRKDASKKLALPSALEALDDLGAGHGLPEFLVQRSRPDITYSRKPTSSSTVAVEAVAASHAPVMSPEDRVAAAASHNAPGKRLRAPDVDEPVDVPAPRIPVQAEGKARQDAPAAGRLHGRGGSLPSGVRATGKSGLDFKERTKHQRLSGQSGIGSDFRTWRTEEEMKLRQSIDG